MFELRYIGHAGWEIKNKNFKIICDPWFSPEGAYFGEWKQFPDNSDFLSYVLCESVDAVYISHIHDDHYDPWTLKQLNKNTSILIPKFKDRSLYRDIKKLGFKNILELDESQEIKIKNVSLKVIPDEGYLDADSCLLLNDGEDKILNLNDCHYDFLKLKEITGDIDLLLLQSSSAIWWPCSYDYNDERKNELGKLKRNNILNRTVQYCKTLNAKNVIPNAGPPLLMAKSLQFWNNTRRNEANPFILMDDSHKFLIESGINSHFVIPGTTVALHESKIVTDLDNNKAKIIYDDYNNYTQNYLNKIGDIKITTPNQAIVDSVIEKFKNQLSTIKKISKFYVDKIDFLVLFDFKYLGKWVLDFSLEEPLIPFNNQECSYYFVLDPTKVSLLFQQKSIDFERYFLGCNFICGRTPDKYNEFLFATLKHFDTKRFLISESLYAKVSNILDEVFIAEHKGKKIQIQKYCPHMFANLEGIGFIDKNDNFVCPLHGWKFSLNKNGECTSNKDFCLKIKHLEEQQ